MQVLCITHQVLQKTIPLNNVLRNTIIWYIVLHNTIIPTYSILIIFSRQLPLKISISNINIIRMQLCLK